MYPIYKCYMYVWMCVHVCVKYKKKCCIITLTGEAN